MNDYIQTNNPFSDHYISMFKNSIRESRYFLEAVTIYRERHRKILPMLGWNNATKDVCYLFNINLWKYLEDNNMYPKVLEIGSIYDKKFDEGYASFDRELQSVAPMSYKTWNSLLHIYRVTFKKELLDERTVFTDEDIQRSFYISGRASRYYEFEEEYSIVLASYFMLEMAENKSFPNVRNPILNKYDSFMPDINYISEFKVSPKVEFIILKELGVIDELVQKRTSKEVAIVIAEKINNKYNSQFLVNTRNIHNIQNILTADSYKPDYTNPKSAYKKHNIKKALIQLLNMDVSLEQCKHLNDLKLTAPHLFE